MKIIVNAHKCEIDKTPVNEKEINITKCEFEFAEEITSEFVKEAYFTLGKGETYKQIIVDNECDIPGEVLEKKGDVTIGVVAYLVENNTTIKRYNPSPAYFNTWEGSLRNAENSQPITPSEMEQYEQTLQDGLSEVNQKLVDIDEAIEDVNEAITETNNLNLDVDKQGKIATVTLTKKDASTKVVTLSDGTSLMFNWDGTKLGIKTDEDAEYTYVDLQGIQGPIGPKGEAFTIKKTYTSVAQMNADFNNMQLGDYVMIASTVEIEDNAKLYTRGEEQWIFISDFSGATGIRGETGLTPNIQIGTVVSGETPSVTRTGTNENPVLNFTLVKGDKGDTGETGDTGPQGVGIASINKTSSEGLVDTYTITYTDGTTSTFNITNGEDGETPLSEFNALKSDVEDLRENQLIDNKEGTEIHVDNAAKARLYEFEFEKESSQHTTSGKNLLEGYYYERTTSGLTFITYENNSIFVNGTSTAAANSITSTTARNNGWVITLQPGTYTLSVNSENVNLQLNKSDGSSIVAETNSVKTFTITEIVEVYYRISVASGITMNNVTIYPQLEVGETATEWEEYTGGHPSPNPDYPQEVKTVKGSVDVYVSNGETTNTYTINLGNNELVGIGDYKDELLVDKSGHCWLNKKTGKVVLDGSESNLKKAGSASVINNTHLFYWEELIPLPNYSRNYITNYFGAGTGAYNNSRIGSYITNNNLYTRVAATIATTLAEYKTWLLTHNIEVYYPLEESQLIDLNTTVDLKLFKGVNNITNSEDGNMRIRYVESIDSIINDFDTRLKALEQGESL